MVRKIIRQETSNEIIVQGAHSIIRCQHNHFFYKIIGQLFEWRC